MKDDKLLVVIVDFGIIYFGYVFCIGKEEKEKIRIRVMR